VSNFEGHLDLRRLGPRRYRLLAPFTYYLGRAAGGWRLTVPIGAETDFESIPAPFAWLFRRDGPAGRAAVIHDWLYRNPVVSRAVADAIFLDAMATDKVPRWQRWPLYFGVRLGGWASYQGGEP